MCSTIMNLLSLANEDSVPGADDFVPVLVFVLIKVGPPHLASSRVGQACPSVSDTWVFPGLELCVSRKKAPNV